MLSSAGCLSGEAATSAGPVGGPCTTPRRCSVTAGASTAAAFYAVSLPRPPSTCFRQRLLVTKPTPTVPVASACLSWTVHAPSLLARTASQALSLVSPRRLPSIRPRCTRSVGTSVPPLHPARAAVCGLAPRTVPGASQGWMAHSPSWLSASSLKPTGGFLSMSFVEIHMSRSSDPNFSDSECLQFFLVIDVLYLRERN